MRRFKVIVEKHPDGYVAYPPGLKGVVVGEGDTYEEAMSDISNPQSVFILKHSESVYWINKLKH